MVRTSRARCARPTLPRRPRASTPAANVPILDTCFEAMKLQNNNQPMPADMRPKIQDLIMCIEHLQLDPPTIPEIGRLKSSFGEDPPPPRFRLLRDANDALTCLAVAMAPEMGNRVPRTVRAWEKWCELAV